MGFRPFDEKRIRRHFFILQASMFFKREAFIRAGGLNTTIHYVMDWELVLKMLPFANIRAITAKIGKWRDYSATKTCAGGWPRMAEIARVGRQYHGWHDRNHLIFENFARVGA